MSFETNSIIFYRDAKDQPGIGSLECPDSGCNHRHVAKPFKLDIQEAHRTIQDGSNPGQTQDSKAFRSDT
jgi:hypothetical protein